MYKIYNFVISRTKNINSQCWRLNISHRIQIIAKQNQHKIGAFIRSFCPAKTVQERQGPHRCTLRYCSQAASHSRWLYRAFVKGL